MIIDFTPQADAELRAKTVALFMDNIAQESKDKLLARVIEQAITPVISHYNGEPDTLLLAELREIYIDTVKQQAQTIIEEHPELVVQIRDTIHAAIQLMITRKPEQFVEDMTEAFLNSIRWES
jgi:hypothetical protein